MKKMAIFIDCTNKYPLSFSANNTKTDFIARGLISNGWDTTVIGSIVGQNISKIQHGRTPDGVKYFILKRKRNVIISLLKNAILQYKLIVKTRIKSGTNILIIDTGYLALLLLHVMMAKLLKFKIAHIITEWPLTHNTSITQKIYVNLFGYFCDTILPISSALEEKVIKFKKPVFRLPILADFSNYQNLDNNIGAYFSYCAHAGYIRNIDIFIQATEKCIRDNLKIDLILVLYGRQQQIDIIGNLIKEKRLDHSIKILTKVRSDELNMLYAKSLALLAPMDPNSLQDKYRFSQKMAEYLSSGRPIITSNVGDIGYYLNNNEDIYFTQHSSEGYYEKMKYVLKHRKEANKVGASGFKKGSKFFHFKTVSQNLALHFSALS
ncbi:glycosyltransferase [uncultured Draconibacterium sp.]|uniref:glycosyltransferase n=1 Tax=uncultured Draconibacterium sp. TaxID=1573823 RepID=UPI002AA73604|nr:glycosyltransferase [uncultured Draconibacterium sp.]